MNNEINVATILDSSLIFTTILKKYNAKVVTCGSYTQLYIFENEKIHKRPKDSFDLELKKRKIDNILENKTITNKCNINLNNSIELKNITRSKLQCQRLAKANSSDWSLFITLTFEDNITNINEANKRFRYFIDKVQRVKKDFKYLCIPEFQKRGAVHYHMLCNIDINDKSLIYVQEDNCKFYHIKYWNDGFSSIEIMKNDIKKVVGYISKYMTKDIDDRLFNHKRYFYSRNLIKPREDYIDFNNPKDLDYIKKAIQDKQLIYQNDYINSYDNSNVSFYELLSPTS